jgi:Alpha-kinase family
MKKDIESLAICKLISEQFNDRLISKGKDLSKLLDFVQSFIYDVTDDGAEYKYYYGETLINGDYQKYNNNNGGFINTSKYAKLAQTLSHFSWQYTKGYMMIVDLQGVEGLLTDPQIHCLDLEKFGRGNMGYFGMLMFFSSHRCNRHCKSLGLIDPRLP